MLPCACAHVFLLPSSGDGHLGGPRVLAVGNDAAVKTRVQLTETARSRSSDKCPRRGGRIVGRFLRSLHAGFHQLPPLLLSPLGHAGVRFASLGSLKTRIRTLFQKKGHYWIKQTERPATQMTAVSHAETCRLGAPAVLPADQPGPRTPGAQGRTWRQVRGCGLRGAGASFVCF